MNSPTLDRKLHTEAARPAQLASSDLTNEQIIHQAFLLIYCRRPSDVEMSKAAQRLDAAADRRGAVEDLFWALLNTPEFLFID